jgi:hypothetical protein
MNFTSEEVETNFDCDLKLSSYNEIINSTQYYLTERQNLSRKLQFFNEWITLLASQIAPGLVVFNASPATLGTTLSCLKLDFK